ncbi:kinase-like protein [Peniophora sp. CONT]|nr:kinase-like protein [Peniophora sp. CONT]
MSFDTLQLDEFAHDHEGAMNPSESPLSYHPGGFHPVALGNVISSVKTRYHIVHKLGWGGFATVWLAQDLSSLKWFALRIRMSRCACEGEDDVLDRLRSMRHSPHLPTIFDMFTIDGPNGRHTAIVTDVIAPMSATLEEISSERVDLKAIVRGLVEAVAHLHSEGIIHGDLHSRNVGLVMSLNERDPFPDLPLRCPVLATPELIPIVAQSPAALALASHFPPYLVSPIDIGPIYQNMHGVTQPHVVKLFDFGNAYLAEKPRPAGGFMTRIAPPEWAIVNTLKQKSMVVFDTASDIWALGLLIFSVMSRGQSLLPRWSDQLSEMVKLVGIVPSSWSTYPAANALKTSGITPESANNLWREHRAVLQNVCPPEEDVDALIALLRRILVLDPAARPSAADILRDPWFSIPRRSADCSGSSVQHPQMAPAYTTPYWTQPQVAGPYHNPFGAQYPAVYPLPPHPQYLPFPPVHPAYAQSFYLQGPSYPPAYNHGYVPYYSPAHAPPYPMGAGAWTPRA